MLRLQSAPYVPTLQILLAVCAANIDKGRSSSGLIH